METKANYTLIGAFTALAVILIAIFTVWLANAGLDRNYARYDVIFEGPVRGLEPGGEVRFNGIKVGEVVTLTLSPDNPKEVVARIKVDGNTPVRIDSVAQLEPAGLTGLAYIQILAGGDRSPLMRQRIGEGPPVIASRKGQLDRLFSGGEGVLQTSLSALARLNDLLSEDNVAALSQTFANVEKATGSISDDGGRLLGEATQAARQVTQAGRDISTLSGSLNRLAAPGGAYAALGGNLNALSARTGELVATSEATIKVAGEGVAALTASGQTTLAEANRTMAAARDALGAVGGAAGDLRTAGAQLGTAAEGVTAASTTINSFFDVATRQTLPDVSRASQTVSIAATRFDEIAQDVQNDPAALIAPAPEREVRWRQ
jgi:phospholipid/cholesterol/gamma-HCH transport system substrate-binding protein